MAQRVVDALEPVQVDEEQGRLALFDALGQMALDLSTETGAVSQAGNLIEQGKGLDMVQIGADLTEQAFHRYGEVGQFMGNVGGYRRLQVAMRSGQEPIGRRIDRGRGRRDRLAGRGPAHRAAQYGDDQSATDMSDIVGLVRRISQHQRKDEDERACRTGERSSAAF